MDIRHKTYRADMENAGHSLPRMDLHWVIIISNIIIMA